MSTMTITITVTGRVGGNNITWSRTATVEGLLGAVHTAGDAVNTGDVAATLASSENYPTGSGRYSTGLAVLCAVHTGQTSQAYLEMDDKDENTYMMPVLIEGVPCIMYNGAGAGGFEGGYSASSTATDKPTIDIDTVRLLNLTGHAPYAALAGLKLIS